MERNYIKYVYAMGANIRLHIEPILKILSDNSSPRSSFYHFWMILIHIGNKHFFINSMIHANKQHATEICKFH